MLPGSWDLLTAGSCPSEEARRPQAVSTSRPGPQRQPQLPDERMLGKEVARAVAVPVAASWHGVGSSPCAGAGSARCCPCFGSSTASSFPGGQDFFDFSVSTEK